MATPTPSWSMTRVYGTWRKLDGTPRPGAYKVTIPVRVVNAADDVIFPAGTFAQGNLVTVDAEGVRSLDIDVPSNNDPDNSPTGWKVTVEITFPDAAGEKYVIDTPADGVVNLRQVVLTSTLPQQQALALRGVPGGLAELDAQGDVVNAAGAKVGGGLDEDALTEFLGDASLETFGAVGAALAAKADAAAVTTALASKADASAVSSLATTVAGKADSSTVTALATTVSSKADAATTTAALAGKVGTSDSTLHFLGYGPTPPDPTGMPDGRVWLLTSAEA